ncbi:metal-dependent hydrolase [Streptomyces gibsoniae]|uniref:Metal-dependent hydrolase n=1 Tax=Streptomyces gibsoniae TaxID=3075529 RepID=A0ABU2U9K4_9ACTN|nr:metal-dependent hydrolase [Streptomyces sp. DSM 41699]MDT0469901.1 metal-dependent hydrolase [Streptomyces sp. DSM 41699]
MPAYVRLARSTHLMLEHRRAVRTTPDRRENHRDMMGQSHAVSTALCPPGHGFHAWGTIVAMAALGTAAIAKFIPAAPGWLPYVVGLGCLAHLLGDSITKQGAPWLWPLKTRYEIVLIKSSGNKLETEMLTPLMGAGTTALLWLTVLAPHPLR